MVIAAPDRNATSVLNRRGTGCAEPEPGPWAPWAGPRNREDPEGVPRLRPPVRCRWWPFLGVLVFLWIVPTMFGFGFRCGGEEPEVSDPETEEPTDVQYRFVSKSSSPSTEAWAPTLLPLLAGVGFLLGGLRGRDA